jgi:hypothetical protein
VTTPPENGSLLWVATERRASTFTQADIDGARIIYNQENAEAYQDGIVVRVYNAHNSIDNQRVHVRVLPAVHQVDVSVNPGECVCAWMHAYRARTGESVVLTKQVLDATEIETKQPNFLVIRAPAYGKLLRIKGAIGGAAALPPSHVAIDKKSLTRARRATNTTIDAPVIERTEVTVFTFADIKNNAILYQNTLVKAHKNLQDTFMYELRADGVQPARGTFTVCMFAWPRTHTHVTDKHSLEREHH